ncbi:GNAT family N-acetyltransferase [Aquimarina spongiae]|uniref:Protein N-acetyltransferase, RimJ/RimL family n=1 Tax=Aquimarina spongiae TaxID=570521 RepID=A0A1M6G5F6_9FLAO|nr:GNAT family N-acetyltransferase [Aquimarina spongiae]SHJ05120.1 Protein N-acetyltransferase, RimJ/RimL family [Aquimarina spongiae]
MNTYIFSSERLGFREWSMDDLDALYHINNDDDVMEFFPFKPSKDDTEDFIKRMQSMYKELKFCYFAVDILENQEFIGFIGLSEQTYLTKLGTFVDIGWRLKKSIWNQGYATEGAKACLDYGYHQIGLDTIYSVAPEINMKSELIMKKIGMERMETFLHPKLENYPELLSCVLYKKSKS